MTGKRSANVDFGGDGAPEMPDRRRLFTVLGGLIFFVTLGAPAGGVIDIPIVFFLKNRLHLSVAEVAHFRLITAIPLFLSGAFGLLRDTWNPFGSGDRGLLICFGTLTACLYVAFAFAPASYPVLLSAVLILTSTSLLTLSAQNGLTAAVGRRYGIPGQVSAFWNIVASVPTIAALLIGGALSDALAAFEDDIAARALFLIGAASMAAVALFASSRPAAALFPAADIKADTVEAPASFGRLLRHRPIYPALLIWLLWNFAPGAATPLQFYLQNDLHAADSQWGFWNALFSASFLPTFLLFAVLCRHFTLQRLLLWGTIAAIPQLVPLLFVHSMQGALLAAIPIGLMGGVATAAYLDLIIRSSPPGFEGITLMSSVSLTYIASRLGDVCGAALYEAGGFLLCVAACVAVYTLILPVLLFVPKSIAANADGWKP